jgi:hypothetical protein
MDKCADLEAYKRQMTEIEVDQVSLLAFSTNVIPNLHVHAISREHMCCMCVRMYTCV